MPAAVIRMVDANVPRVDFQFLRQDRAGADLVGVEPFHDRTSLVWMEFGHVPAGELA